MDAIDLSMLQTIAGFWGAAGIGPVSCKALGVRGQVRLVTLGLVNGRRSSFPAPLGHGRQRVTPDPEMVRRMALRRLQQAEALAAHGRPAAADGLGL